MSNECQSPKPEHKYLKFLKLVILNLFRMSVPVVRKKSMDPISSTIYEQFEKVCRDFPDKPALLYLGMKYSYSELHEATDHLAASLYHLGVSRGDKTILYLSNCPRG